MSILLTITLGGIIYTLVEMTYNCINNITIP